MDVKQILKSAPRMKDDAKEYIKQISCKIIKKIQHFCVMMFPNTQLEKKHAKIAFLCLSFGPLTCFNRQGLCCENVKLKPIEKIVLRCIDSEIENSLDSKIVSACKELLCDSSTLRCTTEFVKAVTIGVTNIITIMLQSTSHNNDHKTMTLEDLHEKATSYKNTKSELVPYVSLKRMLHLVEHGDFKEQKTNDLIDLENKQVKFN
jgi:hypothetical protein